MHKKWKWIGIIFAFFLAMGFIGNLSNGDEKSSSQQSISQQSSQVEHSSSNSSESNSATSHSNAEKKATVHKKAVHVKKKAKDNNDKGIVAELAAKNYHSGDAAYINVNGGQSTLKASDWTSNHISYANLDDLNRTSSANTAYLESRNVANDSLRTTQTVYPTGWHQKFINNEAIINRGHMIAYSLSKGISIDGSYNPNDQSGDQNNPKNLFTQTAFSNQRVQTIYESQVRSALREGQKVVYQVQPIFRGSELMARGVHLQAISTDGSLNFNVYLFNVQPGVSFDYATGRSTIDHSMTVPTPAGAPTFHDDSDYSSSGSYHQYRRHRSTLGYFAGAYAAHKVYQHYRYRHSYSDRTHYYRPSYYYRHKY